jgi:predicted nucleic acid-binding Zn ribbon protein
MGDALDALAGRLGMGRADVVGTVFARWEELVGPAVAAHVQPLKIEGTTLVVSADHPAWAVQIRHLSAQVLERLREATGGASAPEHLEVRVRP